MTTIIRPDISVLGVGFPRTGTSSLKVALAMLGFGPCYHMEDVFRQPADIDLWRNVQRGIEPNENLYKLLANYRSACDFPSSRFPEQLISAFPDSKFILTVRDPVKWHASIDGTIYRAYKSMWLPSLFSPSVRNFRSWIHELIWGPKGQFQGQFEDRGIEIYEAHIEKVKRIFPSERLLVYRVGEGWESLCTFLNVPIPNEPFPHVNESGAFDKTGAGAQFRKYMVNSPAQYIYSFCNRWVDFVKWIRGYLMQPRSVKKD